MWPHWRAAPSIFGKLPMWPDRRFPALSFPPNLFINYFNPHSNVYTENREDVGMVTRALTKLVDYAKFEMHPVLST
jgi:hypothetical protein